MGERTTYGFKENKAKMNALMNDLETLLVREANYLGIEAQGDARNSAGYQDQTGNLKNSIGYNVIHDGNVVSMDSVAKNNPVPSPNGEGDLQVAHENTRKRLISFNKYADGGISVVLVAGMNYASFVEAKGFNVLDATWRRTKRYAQDDIEKIIEKIIKKYGKRNITTK